MKANVYIKYKDGILDPQGKVTNNALKSIGIKDIDDLTIGKYIVIDFGDISKKRADELTNESCKKLLVNPNTQTYTYKIIS